MSKFLGYYGFEFERSRHDGFSLRLAIYENPNLADNSSTVWGQIEYKNTGDAFTDNVALECTANGSTKSWTRNLTFAETSEWTNCDRYMVELKTKNTFLHNSDGTGTFTISCVLKTDETTILSYYRTVASATATGALTPIDQTAPVISGASVTADRYGGNAKMYLSASHAAYSITTAALKITGMTYAQAVAHAHSYTHEGYAVRGQYNGSTDGASYGTTYTVTVNGKSFDCTVPLYYTGDNPLTSGGRYPFTLTVTAENGKTATLGGTLAVAQKVTGIALSDESITLALGDTAELEYSVLPADAQLKGVIFTTSDGDIASVSEDGIVAAVSEGTCVVTITSEDKGRSGTDIFAASLTVTVAADTDGFPQLSTTDYLGVVEITRLAAACAWLAERLDKTDEMQEVACTGRAHEVTDIRTILETLEHNCAALAEREEQPILRRNDNWYELVNGWIDTLNGLRNSISN